MQEHLPGNGEHQRAKTKSLVTGQRHQQRDEREQQRIVETEDQSGWHGRCRPQGRQRDPRPHVTDIGIGAGDSLDRGFGDAPASDDVANDERQRKRRIGRECRGEDEAPAAQLLERRLGDQPEEQRRQREIDQEDRQPLETGFRPLENTCGNIADQDHAKERGGQGDNILHVKSILACLGQVRSAPGEPNLGKKRHGDGVRAL